MITKDRLISGMDELLHVEEGLITLYASFSKALLKEATDITEEKKGRILKILSVLYRDSARHKEILHKISMDVTKGAINEY